MPLGEEAGSEKNYIDITYIGKMKIKKELAWDRTINIFLLSHGIRNL